MLEDEGTTAVGRDASDQPFATPFRSAAEATVDDRAICPYLTAEGPDGTVRKPVGWPAPVNRCTALGEPQPQSDRQQELVCLTSGHVNCPRYLRGVLLAGSPPPKPVRQPISTAVVVSAIVLAASLAASFGFLIVRGGFDLPIASPAPHLVAEATASPPPASAPVVMATASPIPTPSPSPTTEPVPSPTSSAAATPAPTVPPTPRPTPAPTSDRFAVLVRCPGVSDCWIYTIRSGDNLHSIANWFGVSYSRMLAMNPNLATPIRAGEKLRIPTPTR